MVSHLLPAAIHAVDAETWMTQSSEGGEGGTVASGSGKEGAENVLMIVLELFCSVLGGNQGGGGREGEGRKLLSHMWLSNRLLLLC